MVVLRAGILRESAHFGQFCDFLILLNGTFALALCPKISSDNFSRQCAENGFLSSLYEHVLI